MGIQGGGISDFPEDPFESENYSFVDNMSYLNKLNGNDLKDRALEAGNKIIEAVNAQVKRLESLNKEHRPKGLFGRFKTTPAQIKENKKIQKNIVSLQDKLIKTRKADEIAILSCKMIDQIVKYNKDKKSSDKVDLTKLNFQIDQTNKFYQGRLSELVSKKLTPGPPGPIVEKSIKGLDNSKNKQNQELNLKLTKIMGKINPAETKPTLSGGKATQIKSTPPNQKIVFGKIAKELVTIEFITTGFEESHKKMEDKTKLIYMKSATLGFVNPKYLKKLNKKLELLQKKLDKLGNASMLTKVMSTERRASQLANVNEALEELSEEIDEMIAAKKKSVEAYEYIEPSPRGSVESRNFSKDEKTIEGSCNRLVVPENDIFFIGLANKNLIEQSSKLKLRYREIQNKYVEDMLKAGSPSDYKKIADSCNQLQVDAGKIISAAISMPRIISSIHRNWDKIQVQFNDTKLPGWNEEYRSGFTAFLLKQAPSASLAETNFCEYAKKLDNLNKYLDTFQGGTQNSTYRSYDNYSWGFENYSGAPSKSQLQIEFDKYLEEVNSSEGN